MAGSLDAILQGLRDAGGGIQAGVGNYQEGQKIQAVADERVAKRQAADDALAARMEISKEFEPLAEAAQADDFNHATWAKTSAPVRQKILNSGDDALIGHLRFIDNVANERAKDARATAAATNAEVKAGKKEAKTEAKDSIDLQFKIQDRHDGDATTKNTVIRRSSFDTIDALADKKEHTPADDISMIFTFMRMNDPTSTVREGEFATAENAKGVDEKIRNLYNSTIKGSRLTPKQYQQFRDTAETLYVGQLGGQKKVDQRTLAQLKKAGIDPKDVIVRTAEDDLAALREKKKKRGQAGGQNEDAATEQPTGKKMSLGAWSEFRKTPEAQAAFAEITGNLKKVLKRDLTPSEITKAELLAAKKLKVTVIQDVATGPTE